MHAMSSYAFRPLRVLRNPMVQTVLATAKLRAGGNNPMLAAAQDMVLRVAGRARLLASYSRQVRSDAKGLVIFLHGWEGSIDSTYVLRTGSCLYRHGYAVFRLNFRDHGCSHHLNPGLFYATLIEEIFDAVKAAAALLDRVPVFIVGFSLGGNFALRIARRTTARPIANLTHLATVSPVLDPDQATECIDQNPLIRRYFVSKWRRSLAIKQKIFPDCYDFSDLVGMKTIRQITAALIERYSNIGSTAEYFSHYTITDEFLKSIGVPTTLLIAEDDPIIPAADFYRLRLNENTRLSVQRWGGHNAFIEDFRLQGWYEKELVKLFEST